jgi:hypothetical protein
MKRWREWPGSRRSPTGRGGLIGVGLSIPGDAGSFSFAGTFTQTSSGSEQFPTLVGKIVNEQTPYTFGEYATCGMTQVQPEIWVTGRHTVNIKAPNVSNKCSVNLGPGGVFTRNSGTAGTFSAGVDLKKEIGFNLSAQSGYNQNVSIKYTFPSEGGFLCGTNGYPSVASFDIMDPCNATSCVNSLLDSTIATSESSMDRIGYWALSRGTSHPGGGTRASR